MSIEHYLPSIKDNDRGVFNMIRKEQRMCCSIEIKIHPKYERVYTINKLREPSAHIIIKYNVQQRAFYPILS